MSGQGEAGEAAMQMLGKYELRSLIGRGAMGAVHEGWDPAIGRRVAIKTVPIPADPSPEIQESLERFRREAQAAGRLHHPNIVVVHDIGQTVTMAFIVMEFVAGQSLGGLLRDGGRMALPDVRRVMQDLLRGLQYSHAHGVVHRDIKPENLLLTVENEVKITDFGIARIESSQLTQAGTMMGTPAYMSPEQFTGAALDGRTDLYSAGVVLYLLLTGERPFTGGLTAIMHKVLHTVPPPPSAIAVTVPPALDAVVGRAMARNPDDRFQTADDFLTALLAALDTPIAVRAQPATEPGAAVAADEEGTVLARPAPIMAQDPATTINRGGTGMVADRHGNGPEKAGTRRRRGLVLVGGGTVLGALGAAALAVALLQPAATPSRPGATGIAAAPSPPPSVPAAAPAGMPPAGEVADLLRRVVAASTCSRLMMEPDAVGGADPSFRIDGIARDPASIRSALEAASPGSRLDWRVEGFDGPYCGVLAAIADVAPRSGPAGVTVGLPNGATSLLRDDKLNVEARLPDGPSVLELDYVQHDGTVWHMRQDAGATPQPAGTRLVVGPWAVAPPFGTDMILAIASSAPLFSRPRPETESEAAYAEALRGAVANARANGVRVEAVATLLLTRDRR